MDERSEPAPAQAGVERMNRTIKEATVKRYHYETHDQLRQHLTDFVAAYNFARCLKTLRGLTPYEAICKAWTDDPSRFISNPHPSIAGTKHLGHVGKGQPQQCRDEVDETDVGVSGLVIGGDDVPPVLELAEQTLDAVAPAILQPVVRCGVATVALGRDDRLDLVVGQFLTDGISIVAFVGQHSIDPVCDHADQRAEALDIVRLSGRQNEGERAALGIAAGVELGGKPATRPAEPFCLLSPFFMPIAQ